ncbi:bifunctional [glutamine synthetase] adenylyltransferase/[glutamine synthetase]-adenylyl-L-tyrosine phosphorylase [Methylobacterium sp. NEAU 140]|uniref:bifunctional [glutamine synthetase] adenylyltransferase/[glutamine synthetase]-adenylyl-L-tyrosine phosphorylase n=1 Tax=Methylobacterium sp. NEAU 140 TaxID=3064945 RepID=UPI0027324A17|nr:bifunctional [glutamine synthetase] adenylyltransferase/[glutamine synthetase]-adenylyl-L-tyrosine phosphorylase [Methylobacterium sp. NEAU 140]MDP4025730.1 bifunctional [glutamine synthetase] adenylyltransferase/[glutamine synthetase]-adenylyl-L-tyrosine phosphorylase [Methylobacterium sp. NEAU 140]
MRIDGALRERLQPRIHPTPSPLAEARLAEIEAAFAPGLLTPPLRTLLLGLADHSPFLWQAIVRAPERLAALVTQPPEAASAALIARQRAAGAACATDRDLVEVGRRLRINRTEHALLVALADLGGCWDLDAVTAALSDFADASVTAALDALMRGATAAGRLRPGDPDAPARGSGLFVLGLGKLGGRELNYSSDIDLVIFYDPERAAALAGAEAKPVFVKLAQGLLKLLAERNADGYVHRVDYRLRPDPGSTAIALSTAFAFDYYQSIGQDWERAAFIKARPIAGDIEAGEAFLAELKPFIWRKHFDFAAIAEIHALKRQIHAVRGYGEIAVAGHDIKIGRGGIREIEFFAQTQQLVFGGRQPLLRGRRTVETLGGLVEAGWIDARARDELTDAYTFLRTVEHRVQMVRDEQTQRLPTEPEALAAFAQFCGFASRAAFDAALLGHAARVQAHYGLLFEAGPGEGPEDGLVFGPSEAEAATVAALGRLGFREAQRAYGIVQEWHLGHRPALRGGRAREALIDILPSLLRALCGTPDPDGALLTLDRAFARMPAAAELLSILRSHERLRLLFADLLGASPRLADAVGLSPHILDAVLEPDFVAPAPDPGDVREPYRALVGEPETHEEFLDRCRDATRRMTFVTGARLVSGLITPRQAGAAYTGIAEATIGLVLEAEERRFAREHGRVPRGRCCVLALGRLGSRQLAASSDLDLVALYDFDPENRTSDGPRPLDAVVAYNRLAQRVHAALTVPTRRGRLYAVDLRLRPYGSHSPPAVQLQSFVTYYRDDAEPWEHMALTRARVVAGDAGLRAAVEAAIAERIAQPRDPGTVCAEAGTMRALVARERGFAGPHDLKLAPGGMFDLDFLAQAIVLGAGAADCTGLDGATVLRRAGARGLIPAECAEPLAETYDVLDAAYHWQRLVLDDLTKPPPENAARRIARAMGLPDAGALAAELRRHRRTSLSLLARIKASVTAPPR